ncbi:MAG: hypothetical protein ACRC33_10155 [Gemmataceae bacterium]
MTPADFPATLRYHATAEPDTLLADIEGLRRFSDGVRARRWRLTALPLLWIVAGVVAASYAGGGGWYVGACAWGIGGLILYTVLDADLARLVLEARRLKTARALVRALACDVAPGDPVELSIQFGPYHAEAFRFPDAVRGYPTFAFTQYRLPWLAARGRLADGTRFEVGVELHATRKVRAKTKGRKKVKEALSERVRVELRPDALPAGTEAGWPDRVRRARLPGTVHVHRARVRDGRVALEVRTARQTRVTDKGTVIVGKDVEKQLCGPRHVLDPLLAAYGALAAKGAV